MLRQNVSIFKRIRKNIQDEGIHTNYLELDKENLASAKPTGADQGWSSVPVAKDGEKGPSRKYTTESYTF